MAYPDFPLTKNSLKEVWGWLRDLSTMSNSCTNTPDREISFLIYLYLSGKRA